MRWLTALNWVSRVASKAANVSLIGASRIGEPISRKMASFSTHRASLIKSSSKRLNSVLSWTNTSPASNA